MIKVYPKADYWTKRRIGYNVEQISQDYYLWEHPDGASVLLDPQNRRGLFHRCKRGSYMIDEEKTPLHFHTLDCIDDPCEYCGAVTPKTIKFVVNLLRF